MRFRKHMLREKSQNPDLFTAVDRLVSGEERIEELKAFDEAVSEQRALVSILSSDSEVYGWVNQYWELPKVGFDEISWDFGNHILEITSLTRLKSMVPGDIAEGMPQSGVDKKVVFRYWTSVLLQKSIELRRLTEERQRFTKVAVLDENVRSLADTYASLVQFSAAHLTYVLFDTMATQLQWWNSPKHSQMLINAGARWQTSLEYKTIASQHLGVLRDSSPFYAERIGFTDDMWRFFDLPALYP